MLMSSKYIAPSAEFTRLQLEGVIADSLCPTFNNNKVLYEEYTSDNFNNDVILI
jgi:hypothetical protein